MAEAIDMVSKEQRKPSFCKFFSSDPVSENMQIPSNFSEYLTEPLPRKVVLRIRTGNFWTMMLSRTTDCLFLEDGWKKFAADNTLKTGEILLLEYNGPRVFNVRIFGWTGCEEFRSEVEIEEIRNDKEKHEEHTNMSNGAEEGEKMDSNEEVVSSGEKQSRKLGGSEKKGSSRGRRRALNVDYVKQYLDNPANPFMVTGLRNRINELHINAHIIKDYNLKFPKVVNFIDSRGKLKGRTANWGDRRICIKGWKRICRRNNLNPDDGIICEFLGRRGRVRSIKVHIIPEGDKASG